MTERERILACVERGLREAGIYPLSPAVAGYAEMIDGLAERTPGGFFAVERLVFYYLPQRFPRAEFPSSLRWLGDASWNGHPYNCLFLGRNSTGTWVDRWVVLRCDGGSDLEPARIVLFERHPKN